jgi:FKBP-type peptidyl-prolyl cis-trans isomerase (trigger factor)
MKRLSGLKLLKERELEGRQAQKGDCEIYNTRTVLNQGDEIPLNEIQAKQVPKEMIRVVDGVTFIDHMLVLGQRQPIAGIEHALTGMKSGGYRKVRISPHMPIETKVSRI